MHYQVSPHEEAKLIYCTRGAIYDVIVDLRPDSSTFMQWVATDLTSENRRMVYVPEGFAHGFQTLEDDAEVFYQISESTFPNTREASDGTIPRSESGGRWRNPLFPAGTILTPDFVKPNLLA